MLYELKSGLGYLRIDHSDMPRYRFWLPLAFTIALTLIFAVLPKSPALLGPNGLFYSCLGLVSTLPGFYFAGLAAVATFGQASMDKVMPDVPPELKVKVGSSMILTKLSRRQFLSYLFSYLVIISFALCIYILSIQAATPSISYVKIAMKNIHYFSLIWDALRYSSVILLFWLVSSIFVITLHGIYFLSERIHQP